MITVSIPREKIFYNEFNSRQFKFINIAQDVKVKVLTGLDENDKLSIRQTGLTAAEYQSKFGVAFNA